MENERAKACVNVYLILKKDECVLLHLRNNTTYFPGYYGLVSGHVEEGESATDAIIREAFEECGIEIDPENLTSVCFLHRKTDRTNIDIFFECTHWRGEIENKEKENCTRLEFFPLTALPERTIDYIAQVLIEQSESFMEMGWK